jgi:hypothetical protein
VLTVDVPVHSSASATRATPPISVASAGAALSLASLLWAMTHPGWVLNTSATAARRLGNWLPYLANSASRDHQVQPLEVPAHAPPE